MEDNGRSFFDDHEIWEMESDPWDGVEDWYDVGEHRGLFPSREAAITHLAAELYGEWCFDLDWYQSPDNPNFYEALGENPKDGKILLVRMWRASHFEDTKVASRALWRSVSHQPPWMNDDEEFRR